MTASDQQPLPLESSRERVLLAQTLSSAKSWNVQCTLNNATGCEPSSEIAQSFNAWIEKLWEQNGDGRTIASKLQTQLALLVVLSQHSFQVLENSHGLSATLADCLAQGSGIESFDEACNRALRAYEQASLPDSQLPLGAAEQEALACIQQARHVLEEQGLIDVGGVLSYLVAHKEEVFFKPLAIRFVDASPLSAAQLSFFEHCSDVCKLEVELGETLPLHRKEGLDVRIAHAAGAYAQPQLVLNIIHDMLVEHPASHVVVTCKEPRELFNKIGPALMRAGIDCAAQMTVPFAQTDLGRAYFLARSLDESKVPLDAATLSDVLLSPLCDLPKEVVWRFNKSVRGDRLMAAEEAHALLTGTSAILDCMLDGDFENPVFETRFNQLMERGVSPAYVREQQAAYYALRDAFDLADRFDVARDVVEDSVLKGISLPASRMLSPEDEAPETDTKNGVGGQQVGHVPQVRIMSQQAARVLGPKSVDLLVVCDLTTVSYPLEDEHSAARTLLCALGVEDPVSLLARERAAFDALLDVPKDRLVLERCLNDEKTDPLYNSAMFEEFLTAYADAFEEVRVSYSLGEDDLMSDALPTYPGYEMPVVEFAVEPRENTRAHVQMIAPHSSHQRYPDLPRLSPSQIEAYLDCPYKWFIQNRLGVDTLDEELTPAGQGTFLHTIFQRFYAAFGQKVTKSNLEEARQIMFGTDGKSGIFKQVTDEQYKKDENGHPLRGRFAPIKGSTEEIELVNLEERVRDWLVFETTFLPTFHPIAFEQRIQGVAFEGCEISGTIDRIDQDDEGHIVIIDYKGSLKDEHCALRSKGFAENGKIQALLYALLVNEVKEIPASIDDVVGALYVSYKQGNQVKGAYRSRYVGLQDIPTIKTDDKCRLADDSPLSFASLLDHTAKRVAGAIDGIKRGDVAPAPCGKDACAYCPVLICEKRCR